MRQDEGGEGVDEPDQSHKLPVGSRLDTTLAVPVGEGEGNIVLDKTYQKDINATVQSIYGGHPDGVKRTLSQITIPSSGFWFFQPSGIVIWDIVLFSPSG